jgi:hypothetical protein
MMNGPDFEVDGLARPQSSFEIAAPTQELIVRCSAEAKKWNAIRRPSAGPQAVIFHFVRAQKCNHAETRAD